MFTSKISGIIYSVKISQIYKINTIYKINAIIYICVKFHWSNQSLGLIVDPMELLEEGSSLGKVGFYF